MIVDVKILHKILANEIQQRVKKKSDLMTKWALSQGLQFKLGWAPLYSPRWQDLDFPPLTPTPVWYRLVQANARWMKGHQPIRVDFGAPNQGAHQHRCYADFSSQGKRAR